MTVDGGCIVITGGAQGIGRALAETFQEAGAKTIVLIDVDEPRLRDTARALDVHRVAVDVTDSQAYTASLSDIQTQHGPIDLLCSNAGIAVDGGPELADIEWDKVWQVNVMSLVYGARALLPAMVARGRGYFLHTVSAAGLLSQIGAASYATTKHAAIGFSEWLAFSYRHLGVGVSCLCPQGVQTAMVEKSGRLRPLLEQNVLSAGAVAKSALAGLAQEQFLILPHTQVPRYRAFKHRDYDGWLTGMNALQDRMGLQPTWPEQPAKENS
ncbi:MAG: SDR family oxidoreductase [Myxococcota bacterium]|nr:SDR family oxidoreductase [Myxococcota bacterium]